MKSRYIEFLHKPTGRKKTYNKITEIYKDYPKESLGLSYNSLMNVLTKTGVYENHLIKVAYKKHLICEWK